MANSQLQATFISKEAMRRIISDIKDLRKNPLTSHGIYYEHDETDMLKGRALVIGPADTPYADGFYFFKIRFPSNYPHAPPKVEFCTGDGYTRFNPNLYRTGKVCLSILNTWKGEQWSGCQTISSVLLALCTIFNDEPLLNEPGVTKSHRDFATYNEIIRYKNIEVAIFSMLSSVACPGVYTTTDNDTVVIPPSEFAVFGDIMRNYFLENKENIRGRVQAGAAMQAQAGAGAAMQAQAGAMQYIEHTSGIYNMTVKTDYKMLLAKFD
jgi:ubiquitin-conjugating enzyme E2 Z